MRAVIFFFLAILGACPALPMLAQTAATSRKDPALESDPPAASEVPLDAAQRLELQNAMQGRDYKRAETLVVTEADRDPASVRSAKLLAIAGGIFFLDGQYLNSVIAWKKSEAIVPLDERSRFTLAMAYIRLNQRDWARPELEKLATAQPRNPLYLYWLGRLDYDRRNYEACTSKFQKVIELDPKMMRAYDGLGLCHDYGGRVDDAIHDYQRAVELNRKQAKPSPWPHLDLAAALIEKNQLVDAEKSLREAIGYDPQLPRARYELGRVLEKQNRNQEAIEALKQAAALDENYPGPHYLLGRIYRRLGEGRLAQGEIDRFLELKKAAEAQPAAKSKPPAKQP